MTRDVSIWRSQIEQGGVVLLQERDQRSGAVMESRVLRGLGRMPRVDEDVMRFDSIRALELVRLKRDKIVSSEANLGRIDREVEEATLDLREQLNLALLDALDRGDYWVFASAEEQAAAEFMLRKVWTVTTSGTGSSQDKLLVFPLFQDRYPLLYESRERAAVRVRSALQPLVDEFNALAEADRRLILDLRFSRDGLVGLDSRSRGLVERFAVKSLQIHPEKLSAFLVVPAG
ncbi:MAG: hypothetical protein JNM84_09065 [Planctomycetes bacterium]|nr:hypothetical protein [Planctomycetota bacterium]